MIKINIVSKRSFEIIKGKEIYKYTFYKDLELSNYMKHLKNYIKTFNVNMETDVDLDKLSEDIRNLFKEELIYFLLN